MLKYEGKPTKARTSIKTESKMQKDKKSPKNEEIQIQHSIAARCVLSCHDESSLRAKQSEEINLEKIFHRSTMCQNAAR